MAGGGGFAAKLAEALHAGDVEATEACVEAALGAGAQVDEVLAVLRAVMDEVGDKYQAGEYFLPELMMSGQAAQGALRVLLPRIAAGGGSFLGTVVLGTVSGDIHDLGKTILFTTLSAAGFQVHDLGVDVAAERFVAEARQRGARIVAASALMSTTKTQMRKLVEVFDREGLRPAVKIMVGGAAVTQEYATAIGADGYGRDAYQAVAVARALIG